MIIGTSPVRISFAGGGTDMPEFYSEYGGSVVSTTIDRFTYAIIHPRYDKFFQAFSPDFQKHYTPTMLNKIKIEEGTEIASAITKYFGYKKGINVILCSDVPGGSGMGASSSLAVNLINVFSKITKKQMNKNEIAETAFHIGRNVLKWPIGKQDEYGATYGGLNYIKFQKNKTIVTPIRISNSAKKELDENLLLFFIGITRKSTNILKNQIDRIKNKNLQTIESLKTVKELSNQAYDLLKKSDITEFGKLLNQNWHAKKRFSKMITNPEIDKIYEKAISTGAIGGKLTGAGGGGHMLFYCEKSKQKKLITKMNQLGLQFVDFKFYGKGAKYIDMNDMLKKDI